MSEMFRGITLEELIRVNLGINDDLGRKEMSGRFDSLLSELSILSPVKIKSGLAGILAEVFGKNEISSDLFFKCAVIMDDAGLYDDALFLYKLRMMIAPDAKTFNNIAVIYAEKNQIKDAIAILKEGLDIFPNDCILSDNLKCLLK